MGQIGALVKGYQAFTARMGWPADLIVKAVKMVRRVRWVRQAYKDKGIRQLQKRTLADAPHPACLTLNTLLRNTGLYLKSKHI